MICLKYASKFNNFKDSVITILPHFPDSVIKLQCELLTLSYFVISVVLNNGMSSQSL